jgi:acyl-CoA dehydrogenase
MVADIAAEAALARAATDAALNVAISTGWAADNLGFLVAVARSCAGHAASVVVRNAHQAHGAIGTTIEHRLHEYTRSALAWRAEYGSVQHWDAEVTRAAQAAGAAGLWPLIAD